MSELKDTHDGGDNDDVNNEQANSLQSEVGEDSSVPVGTSHPENTETPDRAPRKRNLDHEESFEENSKRSKLDDSLVSVVATHYNSLEEKGLTERNKSRIVFMRNFNNWIKSQLISEYLVKCKENRNGKNGLEVLDMCCGKGGDLLKWRNGEIKHLICVDLADVSVKQCKDRYEEMKERNKQSRERNDRFRHAPIFSAEFYDADCTKVRIKDLFVDNDQSFDLVSCQFSFHYCFESLSQAECMMRNAAESLRPGGFFIGTIPNANDIVKRLKEAGDSSFGNDVFRIKYNGDINEQYPLFGAQYDFFLEGVVNCPEFLVHFPLLNKLAEKYGLKLVEKETFKNYFERMKDPGRQLLGRMQALETYPPFKEEKLAGKDEDYSHAKKFLEDRPFCERVGTLSKSEWDAVTLYMVFAFVKDNS